MSFSERIRPWVDAELHRACLAAATHDPRRAFRHLERAHVLGQASTREHLRAHWHMLKWAWRESDRREMRAQVLRLGGAATKTALGLIPAGNTGGGNISPFKSLPIPADLQRVIDYAKGKTP